MEGPPPPSHQYHPPYSATLGLPGLLQRPRYRPQGVLKPSFFYLFPIGVLLLVVVGLVAGLLPKWLNSAAPDTPILATMVGIIRILLPFVLFLFGMLIFAWINRQAAVRRWWIAAFETLAGVLAFLLGFFLPILPMLSTRLSHSPEEIILYAIVVLFLMLFLVPTGFQMVSHETLAVTYPIEGGTPAETETWYFKPFSSKRVLDAIECGDSATLRTLLTSGPSASGPSWQIFTALTISRCPDRPDQPIYLHLKDIFLGGGPIFTKRIHSTWGISRLHHVHVTPQDIDTIQRLLTDEVIHDPIATPSGIIEPDKLPSSVIMGPATGTTPLGFPVGGPEHATTPNGSYVRGLDKTERRRVGWRTTAGFLAPILGLGVAILPFALFVTVAEDLEQSNPTLFVLGAIGALLLTFGLSIVDLFVTFSYGTVSKRIVRSGVRKRQDYTADEHAVESVIVMLEESRTFNKLKLTPDDAALIRILPGYMEIDLSKSRGRIYAQDLLSSRHRTKSGSVSLRLSGDLGGIPWEVSVVPCYQGNPFKHGFTDGARVDWLMGLLKQHLQVPYSQPPHIGHQ